MTTANLGEISAFITKGATPTTYGFKWLMSGVRFLRSECVSEHGLDLRPSMFISHAANQTLRRSQVKDGDILLTITGNVGRVIRLAGVGSANINQHIARIRVQDPSFDPAFVYHYLSQRTIRDYYNSIVTGQAYPQISLAQVRRTAIPILTLRRQREITTALDDADAQVATLERLVTKKQTIQQGMMQRLLTGKMRLPGFDRDWTETSIAETASVDPETLASSMHPKTPIDYISLDDVKRGELMGSRRLMFGQAPTRARLVVRFGDLLFGTVRPNLQSRVLYTADLRNPVASTGFAVVRVNESADPTFFFNLLMSNLTTIQIDRLIAGSSYPAISSRDVGRLTFNVPELEEQREIAEVLSHAASGVAALRKRLAKARAVKTGMVQELLTGRTRLTVEAPRERS